jgi:hypothetical protein
MNTKTKLDRMLLKNIEEFEIKNRNIPILMQKYPQLAEIGVNALNKKINLTMIENPLDYVYFILGLSAQDSIIIDNKKRFLNQEEFFKKLEDILIFVFDIKKIKTKYFSKRKMNLPEENLMLDICKKINIQPNIFTVLRIKNHNSKIGVSNLTKILNYKKIMMEEYSKKITNDITKKNSKKLKLL